MAAAAQRTSSRNAAHARAVGASADAGARNHGDAAYAIDFLTGKIGLGSHVLVALNRCLTPSQVGRVVAAWRAGSPLARGLDVRGRAPADVVRDPRFGWMAVVPQPPATPAVEARTPEQTQEAALVEKLTGTIVGEVTDRSKRSATVLLAAILVAKRNHVAPMVCERLRRTPHPDHGNCFDALLALTGSDGSAALEQLMERSLAHDGVDVAADPEIAGLSARDKLLRAAKYGGSDTLGEAAAQLVGMLPGLAVFYAASQFTPLGPLLDVLGLAMLGQAAVTGVEELLTFRTMAEEARTDADLRAAGAHFAKGLVTLGLTGVFALLASRSRAKKDAAGIARKMASERAATDAAPTESVPAPAQSQAAAKEVPAPQTAPQEPANETARSATSERAPEQTSARRRIDHKVEGHAESIGLAPPRGWEITREICDFDPMNGHPRVITEVLAPNGGAGRFGRSYDPFWKTFILDEAFLSPDAPRWVQHEGVMMGDEGTPTQSFWTMRQMKLLRLRVGDIESVKMSKIQNVKTILQLARAKREGLDLAAVLPETASVGYAKTPLKQAGYTPVAGSLRISEGDQRPIGDVMERQEHYGWADRASNDALLTEYGFKREDVLDFNFDITFDVTSSAGKGNR